MLVLLAEWFITLRAYVRLTRPFNSALAFVSVWVGAFAASGGIWWPGKAVALAGAAAALIAAAGYVINDWFDISIDRVNRPDRPLPSGDVSKTGALVWAVLLFAGGNLLALGLNELCLSVSITVTVLLVVYSAWLKKTPLSGNVLVAVTAGLTFVFGGAAVNNPLPALVPAVLAGLFHLGREIVKDMEDVVGDLKQNAMTLPILAGMPAARNTATAVFVLLGAATVVPYLAGWYGAAYLVCVIIGVDLVLALCVWVLWKSVAYGAVSHILKVDMVVGLICICVGIMTA